MKKFMALTIVLLCVLSSTFITFADTDISTKIDPEVNPAFTHTAMFIPGFTISEGVSHCQFQLLLKTNMHVDYVQVTAKIKKSTGTTVKTFNEKVYASSTIIIWRDTYKLTSRGSYYMDISVKCYESGKLVETLTKVMPTKTY